MMKLRKWSSLDKAEKLGIKKSLKEAFIVFCIFSILEIGAAIASMMGVAINSGEHLIDIFINRNGLLMLTSVFATSSFISICAYFSIKKNNINSSYDTLSRDYSKKLAEKMLVRGKPTKIKLIRTRNGYYNDFLLKDLLGRVDYYAVLEINHNIIVIYTKFSDENEKDFFDEIRNEKRNPFDIIEMEEFSSFCELL